MVIQARRDAELEAGSDAHYEDVRYYDATYADRREDVAYYVELAAEHVAESAGPVLEYGCGNGRITLSLARSGVEVTGIDRSEPMLASLRQRLAKEPREVRRRVTVRAGDMRDKRLRTRFPLVLCTFNTFLHLYNRDDVERFLARVDSHLAPGGTFVFDTSLPDPEELARKPERLHRTPPFRHAGSGDIVRYGERFDYDPMRQVLIVAMEFEPRGRPRDGWMTPLAHRQFFPQELEALLHYNGFEVVALHGDYEREAPTRDSVDLVFHCRRRNEAKRQRRRSSEANQPVSARKRRRS